MTKKDLLTIGFLEQQRKMKNKNKKSIQDDDDVSDSNLKNFDW